MTADLIAEIVAVFEKHGLKPPASIAVHVDDALPIATDVKKQYGKETVKMAASHLPLTKILIPRCKINGVIVGIVYDKDK